MGIVNKSNLVLFGVIITAVLVIGGFTTNTLVFADDKPTKLMKDCSKEKKKIKIECQILMIILEIKEIIENNKETYPPAGTDGTSLIAELEVVSPDGGLEVGATGFSFVQRSDPFEDASTGKWTIDTEIVSMELTGSLEGAGEIIIRQSSTQQSLGNIAQQTPGGEDFPADSFFDIFVEVEVSVIPPESGIVQPLVNQVPIRVEINQANPLQSIPALGNQYEQVGCIEIFSSNDPPLGFAIAQLCNLRLIPTTPSENVIKSEIALLLSVPTSTDSTIPDQTSCEDGDACTSGDFFQNDVCVSGNNISCGDANECTVDSCNPFNGCENFPISCDDSSVCTADSCNQLGGCLNEVLPCDDFNSCTVDSCDSQTGCSSVPDDALCDDASVCTVDSCNLSFGCKNIPISCDDFDECTADSCDKVGGCSSEALSCDDSLLCTVDSCDSQTGCSNVPIDCDDGLSCTTEACVAATGQCGGGINVNNCVIDNTCYANSDVNPTNECEFCRADLTPGENIRDWSNVADGTSCGVSPQTCQAGVCL